MKKLYKVVIPSILCVCAFLPDTAQAQTVLKNPKVQVVSTQNRPTTSPTVVPYIRISEHKVAPSRWIVLTPEEFQTLTRDEQQNALSKPDIFVVTDQDKELITKALLQGARVENLIASQPLKK